jgi:hypothetical protein
MLPASQESGEFPIHAFKRFDTVGFLNVQRLEDGFVGTMCDDAFCECVGIDRELIGGEDVGIPQRGQLKVCYDTGNCVAVLQKQIASGEANQHDKKCKAYYQDPAGVAKTCKK